MTGNAVATHDHVFLGGGHDANERRTRLVIALCGLMMVAEIAGGLLFGSIALVADGLHMSTHAGALLLAALAYAYARRHADDRRFTFGTGKLGDLAGFTSAVILALVAVLIGIDAIGRLLAPVPISFAQAIPIACLGLLVNVASAWLLGGGGHHHRGGHGGHGHHGHDGAGSHRMEVNGIVLDLELFEDGVPPHFRLRASPAVDGATIDVVRPDGARASFVLVDRGDYLESLDEVPEPHAFTATVRIGAGERTAVFAEPDGAQGGAGRDNNMRAAIAHVVADTAVSAMVIVGLVLARAFGWSWMDPLAGLLGAFVIASWSWSLVRDTGAILLDVNPSPAVADDVRRRIERDGDRVVDLHLWRLGPGHLGAIVSVLTTRGRDADFYRERLAGAVSHLTVEVAQRGSL